MALARRIVLGVMGLSLVPGSGSMAGPGGQCVAAVGGGCPPGWTQWGKACYRVTEWSYGWHEARDACVRMGGAMVAPESDEENNFLFLTFKKHWVACNDLEVEDQWVCGSGNALVLYRKWNVGEPNNGSEGEDCAAVYHSKGHWNDMPCSDQFQTVCKRTTLPKLHL